jgi:hypothetical protein
MANYLIKQETLVALANATREGCDLAEGPRFTTSANGGEIHYFESHWY